MEILCIGKNLRSELFTSLDKNWTFTVFHSTFRGIRYAIHKRPDAIIAEVDTDIVKPLREKNITCTIPIIYLGTKTDYQTVKQCLYMGVDDYLIWPIDQEELRKSIYTTTEKYNKIRKHTERQFAQIRDNIAYTIPHELLSPLTVIQGIAGEMVRYPDLQVEEVKELGKNINMAAIRLGRLTENFIFYTHLQFKLNSPEKMAAAWTARVDNPQSLIRSVISDIKHTSSREIEHELENSIIGINETGLYKIVSILLNNAVNYSHKNSVIKIKTENRIHEYFLSVYNEGRGFSKENIQRIGAYTQFDRQIYEQQGAGLGLAIVQLLVKIYHGNMNIFSEQEKYAEVQISLRKIQ